MTFFSKAQDWQSPEVDATLHTLPRVQSAASARPAFSGWSPSALLLTGGPPECLCTLHFTAGKESLAGDRAPHHTHPQAREGWLPGLSYHFKQNIINMKVKRKTDTQKADLGRQTKENTHTFTKGGKGENISLSPFELWRIQVFLNHFRFKDLLLILSLIALFSAVSVFI